MIYMNLNGELKEAQDLTAEIYGADDCWFSINGTTALIEAMIMGTVGPDETIIILEKHIALL